MAEGLNLSRRLRRTPYSDRVEAAGVRGYTVVNHMLLPKSFRTTLEQDYWHLREGVQIWDVSCQRQVEIEGPDAAKLVQWMTPRDLGATRVGDCRYLPITDDAGGLVNDPVLLKLGAERFWLSIADSDVLLYAKGLAIAAGLAVRVREPDVSPLAVQGPKAEEVLVAVFGAEIRALGFFKFARFTFQGTAQVIARSGYSRQGGFEIYLDDGALGPALWDTIWAAGEAHDIRPGCPNLIERIEGGLLSYGNEMTRANNPFEIGLGRYCRLDGAIDFIGRDALREIAAAGVAREIRGIAFGGGPCPPCAEPWPVTVGDLQVGRITSAAWSPRLGCNVGLAMIARAHWSVGQEVLVRAADDHARPGRVSALPFA